MTRNELRNRYTPEVSLSTIDRMLRDHNIRKWIVTDRSKLKEEHVKKRLAWVIIRKNWTVEDFKGIIYSDEGSVEKSCDSRQIWMFRTLPEKWLKNCIQPTSKSGGVSLMVWGCFWGRKKGPLVTRASLNGLATQITYLALLKEYLPLVLQQVHNTMEDLIFQQDNAPVHKAKTVIAWFEENNIDLEDHPPLLPDLNPIEYV